MPPIRGPARNCLTASMTSYLPTASRSRRSSPMGGAPAPTAQVTRLPVPNLPVRPEYLQDVVARGDLGVVQKPLSVGQRLANQGWRRKAFILTVIAVAWELYARRL